MLLEVAGFQGCYRGKHRNNWRCARAVHALCENAPICMHASIHISRAISQKALKRALLGPKQGQNVVKSAFFSKVKLDHLGC